MSLRVVVAQFLGPAARKLDDELGFPFVDAGLDLQDAENRGLLALDDFPQPALPLVRDSDS